MKNIGIFIGYAPEQPIKNQGIGRLMNFIINGILERNDTKIVIACPGWYKEILNDFLADHEIDANKIEVLSTKRTPIILHIRNIISKLIKHANNIGTSTSTVKSNPKKATFYLRSSIIFGLRIIFRWLSMSSVPLFLLTGIGLFLSGILFSPLIVSAFIALLMIKLSKLVSRNMEAIDKKNRFTKYLTSPLALLKNNPFANLAYEELRKSEFNKLITIINQRTDIPVWFVPSLFWPEVKEIKAKKVIAAPDIVFLDFPSLFLDFSYTISYQVIEKTLQIGDHFICYSDYVKQKHLVEAFCVPPNKISVIEHGVIELNNYLEKNQNINNETLRDSALQILREYQTKCLTSTYLSDYDFSSTRFIFYSSQIRPHKNFLNLIKAYEILLRKRYLNIKLIVTADYFRYDEIRDYILSHNLQYDIISLPSIPSKVLAALNHLAVCAVNPTLFEGGFPFTFNEAYSVGTPSVMSNIPVVSPNIQTKELREAMLFDPYDLEDMVNKIEWGVKNHEKLFELQAPLFQEFKQRTWKVVATDYINLLSQFAVASA